MKQQSACSRQAGLESGLVEQQGLIPAPLVQVHIDDSRSQAKATNLVDSHQWTELTNTEENLQTH